MTSPRPLAQLPGALLRARAGLLDHLCRALDALPRLSRDEDGRWQVYGGAYGCSAGVSGRARRLRRRAAGLPDEDRTPCGACTHPRNWHAAQEGMCLDCDCFGWEPTPTTT